jgi:hypothetical protein
MKDKNLVFTVDDEVHARFKIALFYDRMGQSAFIKHVIAAYLTGNKHIRAFVDELVEKQNIGKNKTKNRKNDAMEEKETINDYALNEEEIENIFDMIESENPDL